METTVPATFVRIGDRGFIVAAIAAEYTCVALFDVLVTEVQPLADYRLTMGIRPTAGRRGITADAIAGRFGLTLDDAVEIAAAVHHVAYQGRVAL